MANNKGTDGVLDPLSDIADALTSRPFDVDDVEGFGSLPFLAVSRYSPLNLLGSENPHSPASRGGKWCDAFEDLMLASQGRPLRTQSVWGAAFGEALGDHNRFMMTGHRFIQHMQNEQLSDVFWVQQQQQQQQQLQQREETREVDIPVTKRVGPNRVVAAPAPVVDRPEESRNARDDTGPATELEMYGQFLSSIAENGLLRAGIESSRGLIDYIERKAMEANPNLQLESRGRARPEEVVEVEVEEKSYTQTQSSSSTESGVLSTMTTTEKTILPDGTVHSRIVLKKRFADGTVKVTESVDEQHGQEEKKKKGSNDEDAAGRKKGWFWN